MKQEIAPMGRLAFLVCLTFVSSVYAGTIVDNFNDNTLDSSLWSVFLNGGTGSVSEINQRLEVTLTGNDVQAGAALRWLALGNFDFQASYTLLTNIDAFGHDQNFSGAALYAFPPDGVAVGRFPPSLAGLPGPQGIYVGAEADTLYGLASTTDQSGRLRMTRVGNVYSTYYWGSGDWKLLGSGTSALTGPADLYLAVLVDGGATVSVAFDDFYIQADGLAPIPEPSSFALAGTALGLICVMGKRRRPAR